LAINIGLIYYFIFFNHFPSFTNRLDFIEKRLDTYVENGIDISEASASASESKTATASGLSDATIESLVNQVSREVKKEIALEDLSSSSQTGFGEINHDVFSSIGPKVIYVPLGQATTQPTNNEWKNTPVEIDFSTDDYGDISSIRFEATLRIPTGNGQVKARLADTVSGPVAGSEITGEGVDGAYVKSSNLTIPDGDRTFRLQLLTTLDFDAVIENARIRVEMK